MSEPEARESAPETQWLRRTSEKAEGPPAHRMTDIVGLLGLGARSGRLRIGVDRVRRALQAGRASLRGDCRGRHRYGLRTKSSDLARARRVPLVQGPSASRLGATVGKPPVMVVGVEERALAAGIIGRAPHKGLRED